MKNNFRIAALLMMISNLLFAQKDVKWTEPQPHPCFYGLKISVLNMGYQEAPKAYLWGIRITNNYRKTVTFRYRLVVGSESKSGDGVAWKLKPGATWTDGGDVFTGNMFQSPSANWKLTVSQVCFDGENCGGPNECYAECDRIQGNEYQPCDGKYDPSKNQQSADVTGTAQAPDGQKADKGYSGAFTEWRQEGKDVKLTIGQNENGIYWKKNANEPPVLFKNIRQGTYRYEVGTDFFIIRFESDNRISFWNNGSLLGYFTKPEEKKNETVKKELSKPENNSNVAPDEITKLVSGKWKRVDGWMISMGVWYNVNIMNAVNGLEIEFYDNSGGNPLRGKSIFKRTSITLNPDNIYKTYNDDEIIAQWEGIIHFPSFPNYKEFTNRKCVLVLLGVPGKPEHNSIFLGSIENGKVYPLGNLLRDSNILGSSGGNESTTNEGIYLSNGISNWTLEIKIVNGGINLRLIESNETLIFYKVSDNQYQSNKFPNLKLKIINSKRIHYDGVIYSNSKYVGSKAEKWINNNPATKGHPSLMLYFDNDGVYEIRQPSGYIHFYDKINSSTYMWTNRPCPQCYKIIYKITNPTTLTIEYFDDKGQLFQTEYYTKASQ
jgi:hypothetical protein